MAGTIAFIGCGAMGAPMAERLIDGGFALRIFDVNKEAMRSLVERGAVATDSPREAAAGADTAFACLPSPEVSRHVAFGSDGVAGCEGLRVYVEMSTIGSGAIKVIAKELGQARIAVLDAPVSGGPRGAKAGTLSTMVAGDRTIFERTRALFEVIARNVFYIGAEPGLGQITKLANNMISAAGMASAFEATAMAVKAGVDARTLIDTINASTGRNTATTDKFPTSVLPRTFDYGGKLATMYKDIDLCLTEAKQLKVPMWVGSAVVQLWFQAMTEGRGEDDYTTLIQMIEKWAGVTVGGNDSGPVNNGFMCEPVANKSHGWKGWRDLPAPKVSGALGAFIDLSHRITEELSRIPSFPQPRIRQITTIPQHRANVTEVHMVVHHGTHLDAPRHFIADGPSIDQVPLERLYGPGVVWRIDVADRGVIDVTDLELARPRMQEGDIVLLDTGRARHINTDKYTDHASLTAEAAEWLVKRGAKIVGVDFATPDLAAKLRPPDFAFPVHYALLSQGVLIAEHVTNLRSLAGQRAEIMFLGLNVAGSDGAQARVIARPLG